MINELQIQTDLSPNGVKQIESVIQDVESSMDGLLRLHGTTEKELDDYADRRGCSYAEAFLHFGISRDELDNLGSSTTEIIESTVEPEPTPGVHVALGAAAVHLSDALKYYSKASSGDGLISAAVSGHPGVSHRYNSASSIEGLSAAIGANRRKGAAAAKEASGYTEMINAGYTPEEAQLYSNSAIESFVHAYVGPDNEKARAKLRKSLERYKK